MHGMTEEDYQNELLKAELKGDDGRVYTLQTTKEIVELLEFEHIQGPGSLKRALEEANRKYRRLELLIKRR